MIEQIAVQTITLIAFLAFTWSRQMNYLHALQQDDYHNGRLWRWIRQHKVYDTRISALLLIFSGAAFTVAIPGFMITVAMFLIFVLAAYFEKDPRKVAKKPFVLTKRAGRILMMGVLFAGLASAGVAFITPLLSSIPVLQPLTWLLMVQLTPLFLTIGNASLAPYEGAVQKKFYNEARAKLEEVNPTIIGITGSYGKTSIKHILGHILGNSAPTLMTPGSVNTLMGITRIIREHLEPNHKYFIVEMGAYGPGSIAGLCALTPPQYGIISSIGHAHYERFKTLDTVAQAKYELAESVISRGGTMIVHEKTLKFEHARNIRHGAMNNFIACGEPMQTQTPKNEQEFSYLTPEDLQIKSVEQTPKGLCVKLEWQDESYTLRAPLYGTHHGHNIALAFACAMTLGMEAKDIKAALATVSQIKHRLQVTQQINDTIIIDDAFNSNPPDFRAALHVMRVLADDTEGRGILVTPGIVELGAAHDEVHRTLGVLAAETCDVCIVVQPERIPTFISGFKASAKRTHLLTFNTFEDAQKWLVANREKGDVILLENDLPDIYERVLKI